MPSWWGRRSVPCPVTMNLLYPSIGFGVGALVGLTGVGGGSLMTPLLVLVLGAHPSVAVGTDLLQISLTKAAGSLVHGFRDTVDWRITGTLALGSLPAAGATLLLLRWMGNATVAGHVLISVFLGISLILTALVLLFRPQIVRLAGGREQALHPRGRGLLTVAAGAAIGFLVTLTSVGGGAIGTTVLLMLYPRIPMPRLVGSDIAHAMPLTLLAGVGHWILGTIDWPLLGLLLSGSVPGIVIGSCLVSRVPEFALRCILALVMALVGSRMLI
ncbi:MAG TPA: sulfite exporter TauE/SafE family protein [Rhodopila sp.]|nr:sulfite exporter TauE/SafE family protein [Rhodopila sp.]